MDHRPREDVTAAILSARWQADLSWEGIADRIGMSPVLTRSSAMGMNAVPGEVADRLVAALGPPPC